MSKICVLNFMLSLSFVWGQVQCWEEEVCSGGRKLEFIEYCSSFHALLDILYLPNITFGPYNQSYKIGIISLFTEKTQRGYGTSPRLQRKQVAMLRCRPILLTPDSMVMPLNFVSKRQEGGKRCVNQYKAFAIVDTHNMSGPEQPGPDAAGLV